MKPIKIRTKDLIFKNSTIFYRKRTRWNFEYLGSPTHPTSSGLLGSGSSINPEEICEEQHLHFEKGIYILFLLFLSFQRKLIFLLDMTPGTGGGSITPFNT